MNIETRQAYSEVNMFLELIGEEMSNQIPLKLRKFFSVKWIKIIFQQ